jgi:hypothetical protein
MQSQYRVVRIPPNRFVSGSNEDEQVYCVGEGCGDGKKLSQHWTGRVAKDCVLYFAGMSRGASLSFTRKTRTFAGFV